MGSELLLLMAAAITDGWRLIRSHFSHFYWLCSVSLGSSVLGKEDDLAVSLRFMNFGTSPPSSDEDSGLSSFVENPQYFCSIIKDKDMCECLLMNFCNVLFQCHRKVNRIVEV